MPTSLLLPFPSLSKPTALIVSPLLSSSTVANSFFFLSTPPAPYSLTCSVAPHWPQSLSLSSSQSSFLSQASQHRHKIKISLHPRYPYDPLSQWFRSDSYFDSFGWRTTNNERVVISSETRDSVINKGSYGAMATLFGFNRGLVTSWVVVEKGCNLLKVSLWWLEVQATVSHLDQGLAPSVRGEEERKMNSIVN